MRQTVEMPKKANAPLLPMKLLPLSPTEWRLMRCVWDLRTANPLQVVGHLLRVFGVKISPKAAGIFLARLEEKGYLCSAPGPAVALRGRPPHIYFPLVTHQDALQWQLQKFLADHLIDEERLALVETLLSQSMKQIKAPG